MSPRQDFLSFLAGVAAVAAVVLAYTRWLHVDNALIVGFTFLLVVLLVAAAASLWVAAAVSLLAMLVFNFFFLPPLGTFYLAEPQNWVALFVFLTVSLVAGHLSTAARTRAREAIGRQNELARLFDLSRDVLLTTDGAEAVTQLAQMIARRFALDFAAICLPRAGGWDVHPAGALSGGAVDASLAAALGGLDPAPTGGHRTAIIEGRLIRLAPLRLAARAVGVLAVAGRPIEPGTLDALAGVVAMAVERAQFLEARKAADLARQSEELKSALLASIAHNLRTPLTAIRVASGNLQASSIADADRREQTDLILAEVDRLQRLFQNILEMARIDAGAIAVDRRWVLPAQIVEAARDQVEWVLRGHPLRLDAGPDVLVQVDPRLTASALAHVLENAAQYSPRLSPIDVSFGVEDEGLAITVRDRGPGLAETDLPHLFERFYRGAESKRGIAGTGMGLSIARGLLAAEGGRISAANAPGGGALFTLLVPAAWKASGALEPSPGPLVPAGAPGEAP